MNTIQAHRTRRGWSRAELARRAGLHPSTVSLIEAERLVPYAGQLRKLAAALDVSVDDILDNRKRGTSPTGRKRAGGGAAQ